MLGESPQAFEYSVKIVNRKKKSDFVVKKLKTKEKLSNLNQLKKRVEEECTDCVQAPIQHIGYIEPGHGLRGKQRWLTSNSDLDELYCQLQGKKEVLLWTFAPETTEHTSGKKRARSEGSGSDDNSKPKKKTRYEGHVDKMAEVDEIYEQLLSKHQDDYSNEQLRSWAHLIQMKKHSSLETAPDKPFWRNSKKSTKSSSVAVSPGKRINLRGQCVDQLQKWHSLLESGAISENQYEDFKSTILEDINKF